MNAGIIVSGSNFFRVNDEAAFRHWAELRQIDVQATEGLGKRRFFIHPENSEYPNNQGSWSDCERTDADDDAGKTPSETDEKDIAAELAPFLTEDSVAVLLTMHMQDDIQGFAIAVNHLGDTSGTRLSH